MKMMPLAMTITDWEKVSVTEHPGEQGTALWKTQTLTPDAVKIGEINAVKEPS